MNTIEEVSGIKRCYMILNKGYKNLTKEEKNDYVEKGLEFMSTFSDEDENDNDDDHDDDDEDEEEEDKNEDEDNDDVM